MTCSITYYCGLLQYAVYFRIGFNRRLADVATLKMATHMFPPPEVARNTTRQSP